MEQETQFKQLLDTLILETRKHGIKDVSMEQYQVVCNKILKFATMKGVDVYTDKLIQEYIESEELRSVNGDICPEYMRFQNRVAKMIASLADTGKVDFSATKNRKKYRVSNEHSEIVTATLDANHLIGEARMEMDTVIRHFFCFIEIQGKNCREISDDVFMEFITNEMPETNRGSIGRTLRGIKYISAYLKSHGRSDLVFDFSQLKIKTASVKAILPYSKDEIDRILKAVDTSTVEGLRDYAILLLGFETGLRGVDIRTLSLADVDWKNAKLKVCQNKTSKPLTLTLSGRLMNAIADYILKGRPTTVYKEIFLTLKAPVRRMDKRRYTFSILISKYSKKANVEIIPQRSFHSLRRSFATELSLAGVPIETISQLLGHKRIDEDKPYLSYNRKQIAFCSMGFDEIPLTKGLYLSEVSEGGELIDFS